MEREHVQEAVKSRMRARPFQPFLIYFNDGGFVMVEHPETVLIQNGQAVYMNRTGAMTIFDASSVSRFQNVVDEPERVG